MSLTKVTSGAITDSAITTAKIEDGTIVNADISASANIAQSKLSLSLPTISSISIENSQGAIPPSDTSLYFDIIGTNFSNPSTVELLNSSTNASTNATTVTYVSATQLRVTASLSAGTYKIRVTRSDGFAGISATALLTVSQAVSWSTSAGSLGTFDEGVAISTITLSATSNSAITYAIQSGSLPTGLSLNTSNGEITGTPSAVAADTTSTFTVRATDAESQFADREFTITVTDIVIFQSLRFNDNDNPYLNKTMATGTSRRIFTFSTWVKRSALGSFQYIFTNSPQSSFDAVRFNNDDSLDVRFNANTYTVNTNRLYRDVSAWYHILVSVDTTQATDSDRVKIYTNGVLETSLQGNTYPTQDYDTAFGVSGQTYQVSANTWGIDQPFDGYMAEVHFIDGQALTPSSFGTTGSNGRWKPKTYSGTYGTNGFYLDFADSGNLGDDESGNTNDFTANNLAATDQTTDTPQNNFCTLNSLSNAQGGTLSEGNLQIVSSGSDKHCFSTFGLTSGKWYFEVKDISQGGQFKVFALTDADHNVTTPGTNQCHIIFSTGETSTSGTANSNAGAMTTGDILAVAINLDDGEVYFTKNGNIDTSLTAQATGISISGRKRDFRISAFESSGTPSTAGFNFGNPSFSISSGNSDENGYGNFEYEPPTGYLALCTNNLPNPAIADPTEHFNTVLYSGNSSVRSITGVGFQPDWIWIKSRSNASWHALQDSSRGSLKTLFSNTNDSETTYTDSVTSFDSDGFSMGDDSEGGSINVSSRTYVAWNWKANAGSTSSNTDGSITSTVQANTTAGFSIVTFTGNGSNDATIGHGLGTTPAMIITKNRSDSVGWRVFHKDLTSTYTLFLNEDFAQTAPSGQSNGYIKTVGSSTYSVYQGNVDTNGVNGSGDNMLAYCFAEIEGYSKFGKYTANGSTDGPFVYTGFRPTFVIFKRTDGVGAWQMHDRTRETINDGSSPALKANASEAEFSKNVDFLSNGIKIRDTSSDLNGGSGQTYIYMAFAENPFVTSGATPVTAR